MQEILTDAASGNAWTNRTLRQISRTGVDVSIPIYTPIHSVIGESSTPASSDSTGTRISIGNNGTSTAPHVEEIWNPGIGNKRQSATPNLRNSDKLDTSIDGNFTNNFVMPPIFTDLFSNKLSNISIQDLYACIGMHLAEDPINFVTPQFVDLGFSNVDALDNRASLWTPSTRVRGPADVSNWIIPVYVLGEITAVGGAVRSKSDYNYKTYLEIWK